ncbi:hypothetical protein PHIN109289_16795 [Phaeobacter inhibens]|uniref:hypothetical protein n=1 Tax=Phaeobacter inhibens TaxID=221822 RepID=UPI0012DD7DD3|nr:hypothetical protein [Phaeobacter inhibens]
MIEWAVNHWRSIRSGLKSDRPMDVGKAITKAFLTLVAALALLPQFTSDGGWQLRVWALITSPPNEIGDTFAGIAGVLAFLWIIITVWLQSQELAAQREELAATRSELKLAREAQEQQVAVMKEQAEVFRGEQAQRREHRAKELLERRLEHIEAIMKRGSDPHLIFGLRKNGNSQPERVDLSSGLTSEINTDVFLSRVIERFLQASRHWRGQVANGWEVTNRKFEKSRFDKMAELLARVVEDSANLSEAEQERLQAMQLDQFLVEIKWMYYGEAAQ